MTGDTLWCACRSEPVLYIIVLVVPWKYFFREFQIILEDLEEMFPRYWYWRIMNKCLKLLVSKGLNNDGYYVNPKYTYKYETVLSHNSEEET